MKVKDILAAKGADVVTVNEEATAYEALATIIENKVGSLLVLDSKGAIVGIVTPLDLLKQSYTACEKIHETKVKAIMTRELIIAEPEDDLNYIQVIITENRIRHLPIIENNKLAGIVSIGDIVKTQLKEMDVENRYLREYIVSKYPA